MKAEEPKLLRVSRAAHELGLHPLTVRKPNAGGKRPWCSPILALG